MMVNQRWSAISDILRLCTIIICYSNNNSNIVRLSLSYARKQVEEIFNRPAIVFKIFRSFSIYTYFFLSSFFIELFFVNLLKTMVVDDDDGRARVMIYLLRV